MTRIIDQNIRDDIINSDHKHYLISASAGSGKTTILVKKAFSMIEKHLIRPYQQIAMITFTRLATRQIRDKVKEYLIKLNKKEKYLNSIKIITTESFILSEVIKPFIRDAFGKEFPRGEELIQNYNSRFNNFDEGLLQVKLQKVVGSYLNSTRNFTYQLGLKVLKKSTNAQKYLKARFPVIMIDEYQDVDYDMHQLFMYLKNDLKIRLVIVGDIKQMLYGFRGANEEIMKSLEDDSELKNYKLVHNFRSHLSIVNYSYQFFKDELDVPDIEYEENRIRFYSQQESLNENIFKFLNENSSTENDTFAYLFARRSIWEDEKSDWEKYNFLFVDRTPLDSSFPNFDVLEPVLKLHFDNKNYNIYNFLDDLNTEITNSTVNKAHSIKKAIKVDNNKVLKIVEQLTGRILLEEEKENFRKTLEEKYKVNFLSKKPKKLALTIHGAKGLEFDHVFINADSFFDLRGNFLKQNHYVSITRPKKSLHIVINDGYESLLKELGILAEYTLHI
ncbi:UvrD-helicase domain-containing protein [Ureibacillus sp. FSL W8-0352]|jgi:superfamily I DNA/RNA helicase|uniref:UvrD-helicase domain-containing protein n=1 Tax=Ureibacillus sp. FSL W8-0352 TaxID=2954596 RepID=UPI0030FBE489